MFAFALAVPAAALQGYVAWRGYADARDRGFDEVLQAAQEAAVALETLLLLAENLTEGFAARGGTMLLDPEQCRSSVALTLGTMPYYAGLSVVDDRGEVVCSALELPPGPRPSAADREWYRTLMRTGRFTISEPVVGRITQRNVLVLAAPIRDEQGRVVGAVSGGLEIEQLAMLVARGIRHPESIITVTDRQGTLIARSHDAQTWVGRRLGESDPVVRSGPNFRVIRGQDLEGRARTFGRIDMVSPAWRVYAGIPDDTLYGDGLALARFEAVGGLTILVLAFALATLAYRGIPRSVEEFVDAVARASTGTPVELSPTAPREFALVADQFNRTLEARAEAEERRRELEEVTRHQQRVELVSRLASGVAHDLNNVLTVIGANAEILRDELGPAHPLRREAEDVAFATQSAAALTRNLLAFSRRGVVNPTAVQVDEVLDGLTAFVKRVLPESVELTVSCPPDPPPIWIDRGNLEQCILNLLINSRDAMPKGGLLRLDVHERAHPTDAGRFLVISISDNGTGIDPRLLPRVFDAFFTTKSEGRGTGLGLTTVHGIVTDAGGKVEVASTPGEGTRVDLWLPVWQGRSA